MLISLFSYIFILGNCFYRLGAYALFFRTAEGLVVGRWAKQNAW